MLKNEIMDKLSIESEKCTVRSSVYLPELANEIFSDEVTFGSSNGNGLILSKKEMKNGSERVVVTFWNRLIPFEMMFLEDFATVFQNC